MAHLLRDAGWSTFWVGKNRNVPIDEWTAGAKKNWPLAQGYDRFYGFVGGETNNWYPSLAIEDNHYIAQPYTPDEEAYLSEGPRRPGPADAARHQADRAGQAVVPVVLPG